MVSLLKVNLYPSGGTLIFFVNTGAYDRIKVFVDYVVANDRLDKLSILKNKLLEESLIRRGHYDILKLLLPHNVLDLREVYDYALRFGSFEAFRLVLDYIELTQEDINNAFIDDYSIFLKYLKF